MHLIAIGRGRASHESALFSRYAERLRPKLNLVELPEARGTATEIKRREAVALLRATPGGAFVVALDMAGTMFDSPRLALALERWLALPRPLCFLIGGAEGLDGVVIDRADHLLSLGPLTWPHMLARAMLAEQLYRARAIASGHPYHRDGRP